MWILLFGMSFLSSSWVLAQNSDSGVLVSPSVQGQSSNKDNSGNNGATNHQNSANQDSNSNTSTENPKQHQKGHKAPSQASINACQDKSEGDACELTTSHGKRAGICSYTTDKKYLFCKRSHKKTHSNAAQQQDQKQGQTN